MKRFYFSLAAGSQYKTAKQLNYPYILINAQSKSNHSPTYQFKRLFVDCGGFSSSFKHGGYKNTDDDYLSYVERIQPDYYALRDYPCEKELLKQLGTTVKEQQQRTIENHLSLLDKIDNYQIAGRSICVIQGWHPWEYVEFIDLLRDYGLITDYMAVGSVCRRTSPRNITKIILTIKNELPNTRLHGFGIKISVLKDKATYDAVYSADSGAWDYSARWRKWHEGSDRGTVSIDEATKYVEKLKSIQDGHRSQCTLDKILGTNQQ